MLADVTKKFETDDRVMALVYMVLLTSLFSFPRRLLLWPVCLGLYAHIKIPYHLPYHILAS